jgi:hypothetical protein
LEGLKQIRAYIDVETVLKDYVRVAHFVLNADEWVQMGLTSVRGMPGLLERVIDRV